MNNKTEAVKVTLRPTQIKKVKLIAKKRYEGNFSMALRVMVDKFEDGTCESCKHYDKGYCSIEVNVETVDGLGCVANVEVDLNDGCNKWEKR